MARAQAKSASPAIDASTRIALFIGKDAYLRQGYTDRLREALEKEHGEVAVERFDGREALPVDVFDECRSYGLMATHKLVVVDAAADFVKGDERRPLVERYAESPSDSATLVLRSEVWHAGKLDKLIKKHGVVIKCDAPDARTAMSALTRKARDVHGVELGREVAQMLVARIGTDLGRLVNELAKLADAAGAGKPITPELVRELTGVTREEQAWEVQRVLLSGDGEAALVKLHELLTVSRVPMQLMRWAMMDLARKVYGASRGLAERRSAQELRSALKLWGDMEHGVMGLARKLSPRAAGELFEQAVAADHRAKTGLGDEVRALELFALRFTSLAR